jgi:predicted transcriptional regulator
MSAKSTKNVPQKRQPVNAHRRKPGDDRVARDNVVYLGKQPSEALPPKPRRRAATVAGAVFCESCKLAHALGDEKNRIPVDVVAGELGVDVETITKYVYRARKGSKQFPLPVTPRGSRMLFNACAIARHQYQMTAAGDIEVHRETLRVRREHDAAIQSAVVKNDNLDLQIKSIALQFQIEAKKNHRRRLKELLRQLFQDEATFRACMRRLEKEINQDLSDDAG